jgi:SAM-dependent methyltransferase
MMKALSPVAGDVLPRGEAATDKMPGHWLLAKMGKRVLRPGGLELTHRLLDALAIGEYDDVVEFAPGLGVTARIALSSKPRSYVAVERDRKAATTVESYLIDASQRCIVASAEDTGLPGESASVVYGEAMLSMQLPAAKARIIGEAHRLLRPGGKYGIHELCLVPDDLRQGIRQGIQRELSDEIHVGVRPLTIAEWRNLLTAEGLVVESEIHAAMHLLEPQRLMQDEGIPGALHFAWNVLLNPMARRRILSMRKIFRKYRHHLAAVALISRKPSKADP